jgi:hypothetical protein
LCYYWIFTGGEVEDTFVRIKAEEGQCSVNLPAHTAKYSLHVMGENKLRAILRQRKQEMDNEAALAAAAAAAANEAASDSAAFNTGEGNDPTVIVCAGVPSSEDASLEASSSESAAGLVSTGGLLSALDVSDPFGQWACPLCTMLNNSDDRVCIMCATPRSPAAGAEGVDTMATTSVGIGTGWWCVVCTVFFTLTATR